MFLAYFYKEKLKMAVTHVFGLFFFVFIKKKAETYVFQPIFLIKTQIKKVVRARAGLASNTHF